MDTSFVAPEESPQIYRIRFMPSELTNLYHQILPNVTVSEIYDCLCKYVTSSVEPIGWHALWRTVPNTGHNRLSIQYDFEVEIIDVLHNRLEAIGVLLRQLSPKESELTAEQFDEKEILMRETKVVTIPLTQLYVVSDGDVDEEYYRTAIIIEQIRFFFSNLWRPWDELANSDGTAQEVFVETKLKPRLELAFDIKDKIIPQSTVNRVKNLLSEAWSIRNKIDLIDSNKALDSHNMSIEDNTDCDYINESDLLEAIHLKLRLEDIEREMRFLEDKHLRIIAPSLKKGGNNDTNDYKDSNGSGFEESTRGDNVCQQNKMHLIAKTLTLKTSKDMLSFLSNITSEADTPVMFHNSLGHALTCAKSGDKMYLSPGLYSCPVIPWIETDIEIHGLGDSNDQIVIESNDSVGDIFINCNSNKVLFSGLTLRATSELQSLLIIHKGSVTITDCVLDGAQHTRNAIIVLSKAKVELNKCTISRFRDVGISERKGCVVVNNDLDTNTNQIEVDKPYDSDIVLKFAPNESNSD